MPSGIWKLTEKCWEYNPSQRPNFNILRENLLESFPKETKIVTDSTGIGKLPVRRGNAIYLLKYYDGEYIAQSVSSLEIGVVPSFALKDTSEYLTPRDLTPRIQKAEISKPVENSFIHAAHGSGTGKGWGEANLIDPAILANPILPGSETTVTRSVTSKKLEKRQPPPRPRPPSITHPHFENKPTSSAPVQDLLGSLEDEMITRPVRAATNFSEIHERIGQSFKKPKIPPQPIIDRPIVRNDSFDSFSEEEQERERSDYQPRCYYEPAETATVESYETIYEVAPESLSFSTVQSDGANVNVWQTSSQTEVKNKMVESENLSLISTINLSSNMIPTKSEPCQSLAIAKSGASSNLQVSDNNTNNPFLSHARHTISFPMPISNIPTNQSFPAKQISSTNPFLNNLSIEPLQPNRRARTPEPRRNSSVHAARSLTPNPINSTNSKSYFTWNHPQNDSKVYSITDKTVPTQKLIKESDFGDLESAAFDWFKPKIRTADESQIKVSMELKDTADHEEFRFENDFVPDAMKVDLQEKVKEVDPVVDRNFVDAKKPLDITVKSVFKGKKKIKFFVPAIEIFFC